MAEYIEREEAKEAVDYAIEMTSGEYDAIALAIDGIPAADVAPVVHCRDCKHRVEKWYSDKRMRRGGYQFQGCDIVENCDLGKDDDFCSRGERKTT